MEGHDRGYSHHITTANVVDPFEKERKKERQTDGWMDGWMNRSQDNGQKSPKTSNLDTKWPKAG